MFHSDKKLTSLIPAITAAAACGVLAAGAFEFAVVLTTTLAACILTVAIFRSSERPLWHFGVAFGVAFGFGAALAEPTVSEGAMLATAAGLVLLSASVNAPRCAIPLGLLAVALPYAWSPTAGGGIVPPAAVVGIAWAIGGMIRIGAGSPRRLLSTLQPSGLDVAVLVFLCLPLVSAAVQGGSLSLFLYFAVNAGAPYVGLRLLLAASPELNRMTLQALLVIGLGVSVIGIGEAVLDFNVSSVFANVDLLQWDREYERGGLPRIDSSLGHPIALGAFLLFPLALWLTQSGRRWALTVPVVLVSLILTFSRGPWVGAALLMTVLILALTSGKQRLIAVGLLSAAAAVFLLVVPVARELLLDSFGGDSVAGDNAELRADVIRGSFEQISVLGNPLPQSQTGLLLPGNADVASFLALTVLRTGIVGLLSWAAIGVLIWAAFVGAIRRRERDFLVVSALMLVQFALLIGMSMITNYQHFFWLGLALLASVQAASRRAAAVGYPATR